jgi:hypothetical protein
MGEALKADNRILRAYMIKPSAELWNMLQLSLEEGLTAVSPQLSLTYCYGTTYHPALENRFASSSDSTSYARPHLLAWLDHATCWGF